MRGPGPNRRHFLLLMAPVVFTLVTIPAGRSDAAEGDKVSPTTVSEGLKTIQRASEEIVAAGQDKAKAEEAARVVEPVWTLIEGTIKANDQEAYEAFEHALDDLSVAALAGDTTQAEEAAGALSSTTKAYAAKFPERAAAAAPAKSPAPGRSAAAAGAPAAAEAGDAALARTGSTTNALAALAGLSLALGGLAVMGGARRPISRVV